MTDDQLIDDTNDGAAAKRALKMTTLLQDLEGYLNEVVAGNHGTMLDELERVAINNLQRSLRANVEYHAQMQDLHKREDENIRADYHKVMANVYASMLK